MKSCQCARCNVSSARFAWGFALLARDGWQLSPANPLTSVAGGVWLCPTCRTRQSAPQLDGVPHERANPSRAHAGRSPGRLRILLVDDEEMVRRCTLRMLSGFDVVSAACAVDAIRILRSDDDFDVILSDVMMPGMSGPELYALCHRNFPGVARRFVFASGNVEAARTQLQQAVNSVGALQSPTLLSKPGSREALLLAIHAAASTDEPRSGLYRTHVDTSRVTKYRG